MSEFTDQVRNSAALSNLKEISGLLIELGSVEWDVQEAGDLITRLTVVSENIRARLSIADRNLVPGNVLAPLESQTQELLTAIQSLSNAAPSVPINIARANRWIDDVLATASTLPVLPIRTTNAVLTKASEQFDREATSAKASISAEVEALRLEMEDFRQGIQQALTEFNNRAVELQGLIDQRSDETQGTTNSLMARTNQAIERLERDVTNIQGNFRDSQSDRSNLFAEAQESREREFHEKLDPVVGHIESLRDQAKGMLEEIAGASSAEHYAKQRDDQKRNADLWRWIGIAAAGGLIAAAIWIYFDSTSAGPDFSFNLLAGRTGLLGALVLLVTYALRQSGQHRRREEEIGRVANELSLLWPFVSRLPDEDRKELMLGITPLYFKGGLPMRDQAEHAGWHESIRNAIAKRQDR